MPFGRLLLLRDRSMFAQFRSECMVMNTRPVFITVYPVLN
mgnify:FL=1|jgi:hypothetical protein